MVGWWGSSCPQSPPRLRGGLDSMGQGLWGVCSHAKGQHQEGSGPQTPPRPPSIQDELLIGFDNCSISELRAWKTATFYAITCYRTFLGEIETQRQSDS